MPRTARQNTCHEQRGRVLDRFEVLEIGGGPNKNRQKANTARNRKGPRGASASGGGKVKQNGVISNLATSAGATEVTIVTPKKDEIGKPFERNVRNFIHNFLIDECGFESIGPLKQAKHDPNEGNGSIQILRKVIVHEAPMEVGGPKKTEYYFTAETLFCCNQKGDLLRSHLGFKPETPLNATFMNALKEAYEVNDDTTFVKHCSFRGKELEKYHYKMRPDALFLKREIWVDSTDTIAKQFITVHNLELKAQATGGSNNDKFGKNLPHKLEKLFKHYMKMPAGAKYQLNNAYGFLFSADFQYAWKTWATDLHDMKQNKIQVFLHPGTLERTQETQYKFETFFEQVFRWCGWWEQLNLKWKDRSSTAAVIRPRQFRRRGLDFPGYQGTQ